MFNTGDKVVPVEGDHVWPAGTVKDVVVDPHLGLVVLVVFNDPSNPISFPPERLTRVD